jgi:hypothetical protein
MPLSKIYETFTLQNMYVIEHVRHSKVANFMVHLVAGTYQPQKPSACIDYSLCYQTL